MRSSLTKYLNPQNYFFWTGFLLVFTTLHFNVNFDFLNLDWNNLFILDGDAEQYIGSSENLLKNGEFTFFKSNEHLFFSNLLDQNNFDKGIYYAFRTPGFAILYLPIRLMFDYQTSLYILLFFQVLLNSITKYLICLLVFYTSKSSLAFYLGILTFLFSFYFSFYNNFFLTESFAIFFLIAALFLLNKGLHTRNKWTFLWSGIMLTEAILLRPFLAPLFLPFILLIISQIKTYNVKSIILIFLIPLIIFESYWLTRNYLKSNEFIPLSKTMPIFDYSNRAFLTQKKIIENIAVSGEWWVKSSPTYWFTKKEDKRSPLKVYPKSFFSQLNDTSLLIDAKINYLKSINPNYSIENRSKFEKLSSNQLLELKTKNESKNKYYIINSRLGIAISMLNQPLYKQLISMKYPINIISVALESLFLRFTFIFGFISTIIAFFRFRKNYFVLLMAFIPIYIFSLFSIIMRHFEYREMFIPSFFFLFFGIEMMSEIYTNKKFTLIVSIFSILLILVYFDVMNNVKF